MSKSIIEKDNMIPFVLILIGRILNEKIFSPRSTNQWNTQQD